jgi:hypothetical protein
MERNVRAWRSKFARFIRAYGVTRLARGLDVRTSTVYHWIRGATAPRRVHAAILQRLARESGVKLTLDQIFQHSRNLQAGAGGPSATSVSANVVRIDDHRFAHVPPKRRSVVKEAKK